MFCTCVIPITGEKQLPPLAGNLAQLIIHFACTMYEFGGSKRCVSQLVPLTVHCLAICRMLAVD